MSRQSEDSSWDKPLKRIEYDVEWNNERANCVRNTIREDIQRSKMKRNIAKILTFTTCLSAVSALLFFIYGMYPGSENIHTFFLRDTAVAGDDNENEQIRGESKGKEQFVSDLYDEKIVDIRHNIMELMLTEKGKYQLVLPRDVSAHIDTIIGDAELTFHLGNNKGEIVQGVSGFYSSTISDQISITTQNYEERSVQERINDFLPHPEYPSESYTAEEININGKRAVIQQSNRDNGGTNLYIFGDRFSYYMHSEKQMKGLTNEEKEAIRNELIQLGTLFRFENEFLEWK
jgi:cell division protein FtsB